jgi:phosphoribosylaminoimidazolecarboxamide formyltransferase/IMP cyclohydrolase
MNQDRIPVRRALLSVSDKTGLVELATALRARGVTLLSTGGSAKALRDAGLAVTEVSDVTGFPEIMEGRVKTLHPAIHGGLLGRGPVDSEVMEAHGIAPIDLLVLNLYPFEQTTAREDCTLAEAVENIDIGGPAMLRAAAKNYPRVAVLTDPNQYASALAELEEGEGAFTAATRFALSVAAFERVARYDLAISRYLSAVQGSATTSFPEHLELRLDKVMDLRYGENPHQQAAFYRDPQPATGALAGFVSRQGKALSFNNLADADAAWECVKTFDRPACVIVKHANPCGVAEAADLDVAYDRAYATDPTSAFGGIIAFNRPLDAGTMATIIERQFVEVILGPAVSEAALELAARKPNVRVIEVPQRRRDSGRGQLDFKRIGGGLLVQSPDDHELAVDQLRVVSRRRPDDAELADLMFAWRVAKYVKSNAIVYARDGQTIGIGAGQMSRIVSARIAALKAEEAGLPVVGSVMASDAFFPFRDGIDAAARVGIRAVIHPGGSMRDSEVIAAADEHEMAMVLTGIRHFRH